MSKTVIDLVIEGKHLHERIVKLIKDNTKHFNLCYEKAIEHKTCSPQNLRDVLARTAKVSSKNIAAVKAMVLVAQEAAKDNLKERQTLDKQLSKMAKAS